MAEWNINKPLGKCCGTGKEFEPGEEYFASLVQTENGLERKDFSAEYWNEHKPDVYCFWKTRLPYPEEKKKLFVDDDMLMAFFERLEEETEQEKINFRFVLSLILMRKKKLKYESSRVENGTETWKLKVTGRKEYTEVVNPELDEEQIEQLTSQLGSILQAEL
jgi:hypothetical protein